MAQHPATATSSQDTQANLKPSEDEVEEFKFCIDTLLNLAIESTLLFGLKVDNTNSKCWQLGEFSDATQKAMRENSWYAKPDCPYHTYRRWREIFRSPQPFEEFVSVVKLAVEDMIETSLKDFTRLYKKYGKTISDRVCYMDLGPGGTR